MITRLSHTTIYVLDQEEAMKFYRDKLGLEVRDDMTMDNGCPLS
jgi:catechol 2,3-dioxygenase-like lactoylglutathione lyase family enzyme